MSVVRIGTVCNLKVKYIKNICRSIMLTYTPYLPTYLSTAFFKILFEINLTKSENLVPPE